MSGFVDKEKPEWYRRGIFGPRRVKALSRRKIGIVSNRKIDSALVTEQSGFGAEPALAGGQYLH
ncbi:MAG: hypothetical protein ABR514_06060, partial [Chthoniobacterales bacterium]